jgi:hypothetical protein
MQTKTQEKLERIMELQRQQQLIENELDTLLGEQAKPAAQLGMQRKMGRPRSHDRLPVHIVADSREKVRSLILEIGASAPRFSDMSIMQEAKARSLRTNHSQISQLLRYMEKRGALVRLNEHDNGYEWFSRVSPSPAETQTPHQNKPAVSFWGQSR